MVSHFVMFQGNPTHVGTMTHLPQESRGCVIIMTSVLFTFILLDVLLLRVIISGVTPSGITVSCDHKNTKGNLYLIFGLHYPPVSYFGSA